MSTTAETIAGLQRGEMKQLASLANELTLERKLLELMRREKVVSPEIREQAYWLGRKRGGNMRRRIEEEIGKSFVSKGERGQTTAKQKGRDAKGKNEPW